MWPEPEGRESQEEGGIDTETSDHKVKMGGGTKWKRETFKLLGGYIRWVENEGLQA